jgi:threonyl-tRNA synthetase
MLHQATFGSLERFFGILLEHHAGKLPLWLSPKQIVVMSITNEVEDYAIEVSKLLENSGIRTIIDVDSDKIGYKIRKHSLNKVPVQIVIGKQEAEQRTINVRRLGENEQENVELEQFISKFVLETQQPI